MAFQPHASERIQHQVTKADLIHAFTRFMPSHAVLSAPEQLKPYECDGLVAYQCPPWIVVLPETIKQVQAVLLLCYQKGVPVTARASLPKTSMIVSNNIE